MRLSLPKLAVAQVAPGDVLIVQTAQPMTARASEVVIRRINKLWPGHDVLIMDGGHKLQVFRPVREEG